MSTFPALAAAFFAGIVVIGLWTGRMLSGIGSFDKQRQPAAFWASGCLWGICCLIFLFFTVVTLLPGT
jgi:hypothetical protein